MSELLLIKYLPSNLSTSEFAAVLGNDTFDCYGSQVVTRHLDNRKYAFVRILSHLSQDEVVEKLDFLDALGQGAYVDKRIFTFTGWVSDVVEHEWIKNGAVQKDRDGKNIQSKYYQIDSDELDSPLEIVDLNVRSLGLRGLAVGQMVEYSTYEKENESDADEAATTMHIADMTNLFRGSIVEKEFDWLVSCDAASTLSRIHGAYGAPSELANEGANGSSNVNAAEGAVFQAILSRSQRERLREKNVQPGDCVWLPIFASNVICQAGDFVIHAGKYIPLAESSFTKKRSDTNRPAENLNIDRKNPSEDDGYIFFDSKADNSNNIKDQSAVRFGVIKFIDWKKKIGFITENGGDVIFIPPPIVKKILNFDLKSGSKVSFRTLAPDDKGRQSVKEILPPD